MVMVNTFVRVSSLFVALNSYKKQRKAIPTEEMTFLGLRLHN